MSTCLLPDLVGCAMVVGLPVGVVGILVGIKIFAGILGEEFAGGTNRAVGSVSRVGVNNVCAVGMQDA
jgi:hypothetical protein